MYGVKPSLVVQKETQLYSERIYDGYIIDTSVLPKGRISISIDNGYHGDPDDVYIKVYSDGETPNPNYEKELAAYNKRLDDHKKALSSWNKWAKIWREQVAQEKIEKEIKLLAELKKKYDN